jgi:hypothetical protein
MKVLASKIDNFQSFLCLPVFVGNLYRTHSVTSRTIVTAVINSNPTRKSLCLHKYEAIILKYV